ncbi:DNA polymerase I [hydrothermal vent metagenome]|uniref:DNA-directed DNA polymerase n=1 Tax=hydrothermal vent metagenome TaxID=652676 RepID=A0A1W1EL31_9ZZZZ
MKTITIIDTFGFFFRSYYALPPLKNSKGFPTGLLTGFIKLVENLQKNHKSDYLVFALDSKGKTFRNDLYPEYKAHRPAPPEDLTLQLPIAIDWIREMGFANIAKDGYEADDVIATLSRWSVDNGLKVQIISHDKDLYQLIDDDKIIMYDSVKKQDITTKEAFNKFGVYPKDFTNFQAILGDSADNIPGVKGIGIKGASKLINEFGTLENIYENIDIAGTPRIKKLLLESREKAFLSRELVTLRDDIFKDFDIESFEFENKNYLTPLIDDFQRYEMKQAIKGALEEQENEEPHQDDIKFQYHTINNIDTLNSIIDGIDEDTIISFDTETTGLDTKIASIVGFSFSFNDIDAYYVPISHNYLGVEEQIELDDGLDAIKRLFKFKIVGQNLKFDLSLLYNRYRFDKLTPYADTMLMAWLIDSSSKVGLDFLSKKYFDYNMKPFKDMVKKGENFSSVDIDNASFYASEDAFITRKIYFRLLEILSPKLQEIARDIEYPFINILAKIERNGIKIDINQMSILEKRLDEQLKSLTLNIYTQAGEEFNIKSPKQLGMILFERLNLKSGKKSKSGYSTNENILKQIENQHPIIKLILEYREYQKILSTYIKPLKLLAQKRDDNRIFTNFLQTGTATGRLSSRDPNLQNIPVRSQLGREVRGTFIAKDGYKLVGIDYSQIELRLLAHFSQDKALLEAFNSGVDIHLATAIKLFGEEEAQNKRSFAKSINFGLLYGMGSRKLSQELNISTKEAKDIITNYFEAFPTIREFLDSVIEKCKVDGFVETITQRKRLFDYTNANAMVKASIERESVNTLFQGSASDLIKLSMIEIDKIIDEEEALMLLQIHDELIFEIRDDRVEELSSKFAQIMENIISLNVKLECTISVGNSWKELK